MRPNELCPGCRELCGRPHGVPPHVAEGARWLLGLIEANVAAIHGREEEGAVDRLHLPDAFGDLLTQASRSRMMHEVRRVHEGNAIRATRGRDGLKRAQAGERLLGEDVLPPRCRRDADRLAHRCRRGHVHGVESVPRHEIAPVVEGADVAVPLGKLQRGLGAPTRNRDELCILGLGDGVCYHVGDVSGTDNADPEPAAHAVLAVVMMLQNVTA